MTAYLPAEIQELFVCWDSTLIYSFPKNEFTIITLLIVIIDIVSLILVYKSRRRNKNKYYLKILIVNSLVVLTVFLISYLIYNYRIREYKEKCWEITRVDTNA